MADVELRRILRLVSARSLNTFGRSVLTATVLWELYDRTKSKLVLAAVGGAQVVPVVLLFVPAGTLVDRSDRRALATLAAMTTGVVGLGLALVSALMPADGGGAGSVPVSLYLALLVVQGCATSIHAPAVSSLLPLIIAREQLTRTNRISSSLQELAAIIGPALAGLALKFVAPAWVYAALAVTGLAAGVLYRSLPKPRAVASQRGERAQGLARRPALHLPLAAAVAGAHARHVRGAVRRGHRAAAGGRERRPARRRVRLRHAARGAVGGRGRDGA